MIWDMSPDREKRPLPKRQDIVKAADGRPELDEGPIHGLFAVLREHGGVVSEHFAERVRRRVRLARRRRRGVERSLVARILIEASNLISSGLSRAPARSERDEEEDPKDE